MTVNDFRIYTDLSIRTSDPKLNLLEWKSTCCKQILIFFPELYPVHRTSMGTSVKIFTVVDRIKSNLTPSRELKIRNQFLLLCPIKTTNSNLSWVVFIVCVWGGINHPAEIWGSLRRRGKLSNLNLKTMFSTRSFPFREGGCQVWPNRVFPKWILKNLQNL